MLYVAIGGGRLKSWRTLYRFQLLSLRALKQARRWPGNVHASVHYDGGQFFSCSVWESKEAMRQFAVSGVHRSAMQKAPDLVASFRFHKYYAETIPSWEDALGQWRLHG